MSKLRISLSAQMTVQFSASPWRGELEKIYTEYVWVPRDDEKEAFRMAVMRAAEREAVAMNKDKTMVAAQMMRTRKLLAACDGFVSMGIKRKIQRRKL